MNDDKRLILRKIEDGRKALLKWQDDTGITLVQICDPDGVETFDEDGNRVRQYSLAPLYKILARVEERAKVHLIYCLSPEKAIEKATKEVINQITKDAKVNKDRIDELSNMLQLFRNESQSNPTNLNAINETIFRMVEASQTIPDSDKVQKAISEGETKRIEFKSTFSLDVKKQTKELYVQDASLKTIVAFLNTDGGTLLIGVCDDGRIGGVDGEINRLHENSDDRYLLHFKSLLKSGVGEQFYPLIDFRLVHIENAKILYVNCRKSNKACFLRDKDFYVRAGPSTDKLDGTKMVEYIDNHFKRTSA